MPRVGHDGSCTGSRADSADNIGMVVEISGQPWLGCAIRKRIERSIRRRSQGGPATRCNQVLGPFPKTNTRWQRFSVRFWETRSSRFDPYSISRLTLGDARSSALCGVPHKAEERASAVVTLNVGDGSIPAICAPRKRTLEVPVQNSRTKSRIRNQESPRALRLFDTLQRGEAGANYRIVIMFTPPGRLPRRLRFLAMTPSVGVGNGLPTCNFHGER